MNNPATLTVLALTACATVSQAGIMQITDDSRRIVANMQRWLDLANDDTHETWHSVRDYSGAQPSWAESIAHTNETGVFDASQSSLSTSAQLSAVGSLGVTTSNPEGLYQLAWNSAGNDYIIDFTIAEDTEFSFDVDLLGTGNIETSVSLTSTDGGAFDLRTGFFGQYGFERHEELHETFTLSAGSYRLNVFNEILADTVSHDFHGPLYSAIDFDVQLNVIPTPSSLALLSIAGIASTRRRRAAKTLAPTQS